MSLYRWLKLYELKTYNYRFKFFDLLHYQSLTESTLTINRIFYIKPHRRYSPVSVAILPRFLEFQIPLMNVNQQLTLCYDRPKYTPNVNWHSRSQSSVIRAFQINTFSKNFMCFASSASSLHAFTNGLSRFYRWQCSNERETYCRNDSCMHGANELITNLHSNKP